MSISFEQILQNKEPFMGPLHNAYFRHRLLKLRRKVLMDHLANSKGLSQHCEDSDTLDQACNESEWLMEASLCNKALKEIQDIDAALHRLRHNTYGYCKETGEPIPIQRLNAYLTAQYTCSAQAKMEQNM